MRSTYRILSTFLLLSVLCWQAQSQSISQYQFSSSTGGSLTDMSSATSLLGTYQDDAASSVTNIGFTFKLTGTDYTQFSVSSNGALGLGSSTVTTTYCCPPSLASSYGTPVISAFWRDQYTAQDGGVYYLLSGTSPNRVLTVEWRVNQCCVSSAYQVKFQVRLYETSNAIEFVYGSGSATYGTSYDASVGVSISSTSYACINTSTPSVSFSSSTSTYFPTSGTIYKLAPCVANLSMVGNLAQGGTTKMANNDSLLAGAGFLVQRGNTPVYQPFSASNGSVALPACGTRVYTYSISGPSASEYSLSNSASGPFSSVLIGKLVNTETNTPYIRFAPAGLGVRPATLTIQDDNGLVINYNLAGSGSTRVQFIGNIPEGGTAAMAQQDTLMGVIRVDRFSTRDCTPFSTMNFNTNGAAPAMPVTYTITDPTNQYKLVNPVGGGLVNTFSTTLSATQTSTPVIRFLPVGVARQLATLTVTTEDGKRTFNLFAYSRAAGADFFINNTKLTSDAELFKKDFICAGESAITLPVVLNNIGEGTVRITGVEVYDTDTTYTQGVPKYPLRRVGGLLVPTRDYFLTLDPGVAPATGNLSPAYPIETPEAQTSTFYLTFVPQLPGKRFTRMFIYTNAANFTGVDVDGKVREGVLVLDMFGRGLGSHPSVENMTTLTSVTMPKTMVGKTSTTTIQLCNTGACDLRVGRRQFRVFGGDASEFKIVDAFSGIATQQSNDDDTWVIPPDSCASITFSFTPSRSGTRRATVQLQTNDSTLIVQGNTERGSYYWDISGTGLATVETKNAAVVPTVIDGPAAEAGSGSAHAENNTTQLTVIDKIVIAGPDAAEFAMNPAKPWPATPFAISPGQSLDFSVIHTPATGSQPGPRSAMLLLITNTNDTLIAAINGEATTRTIAVAPATLFDDVTIPVGKLARQTVIITNSGTATMKLGATTITGPTSTDYTLGRLPRTTLAPGQSEFLEVTYRPLNQGTSSATLTV
ncbi:MAG: choice-of-anchor D domain-containing protein, partial [Chlorobi bacterium]|nr:choice-of-anchor D domain-containing protein [Chlorobiota bacterium]